VIVLDTSFLVAFHNSRDVHHAAARPLMNGLVAGKWGPALLLEYVFLEVTTVLLVRRNLNVACSVASILLQAREVDFVPCSELFVDTLETFRNHPALRSALLMLQSLPPRVVTMLAILQLSTGNSPILKASQSCVNTIYPKQLSMRLVFERVLILFTQNQRRIASLARRGYGLLDVLGRLNLRTAFHKL
jgi:predicted nucleic acid-binding protein